MLRSVWQLSGERIREIREQRGYSRVALALRMGVRMEAVRNWEGGRNKVTSDNLMLLATALDCHPGEFVIGVEVPFMHEI